MESVGLKKKTFMVIAGANTTLLAAERSSLADIRSSLERKAAECGIAVDCREFTREGDMVISLQEAAGTCDGIIINAGEPAYFSDALRSAIDALRIPSVEVCTAHMHNLEESRHASVISPVCVGVISGFGTYSYLLALDALVHLQDGTG